MSTSSAPPATRLVAQLRDAVEHELDDSAIAAVLDDAAARATIGRELRAAHVRLRDAWRR